jgi:hypothetical protein
MMLVFLVRGESGKFPLRFPSVVDDNQWLPGADTILVVDDDSDTCEALCEWLKRCGHSVT